MLEIGFGMVLCTWAYFGFFTGLLESNDLLLDDNCKVDIERVTDVVEPNFRETASGAELGPKLLRFSAVSCDPVANDLDDVGVTGKSLTDLRTLGIDNFVILNVRPELVSLIDNRRFCNKCGDACCKKKNRWVHLNMIFYPRILSYTIAHTFRISFTFATMFVADVRIPFSDWSKALFISIFSRESLNCFKSLIVWASWFSSRTKVSDLPIFVTQIAGLDRDCG